MGNRKKIRFAVVGAGHIGKRHAEMIRRDEGAVLVAICDIRPKEELGIEAYDVPFFRSLEDLLQSGLIIEYMRSEWPSCPNCYSCHGDRASCGNREANGVDSARCGKGGLCFTLLSKAGVLCDAESLFPTFCLDKKDGGIRQIGENIYGAG